MRSRAEDEAMQRRQKRRGAGFLTGPVDESQQAHQKQRLGIGGDEKERSRPADQKDEP